MKKTTNQTQSLRMTRREFVGRTLLTAGAIAGAPALLRGQNLNNKLNIAFIACGGRANASLSELTIVPGRRRGGAGGGKKKGRAGGGRPAAPPTGGKSRRPSARENTPRASPPPRA